MTSWGGSRGGSPGWSRGAGPGRFVLGLLSGLRRKNCWTIAELAGDATPDGMHHLLAAARWDADAVRDDLRGYVIEYLSAQSLLSSRGRTRDRPLRLHPPQLPRLYPPLHVYS